MDILGLAFAGGWASGLNACLTVLALGLLGRFGGIEQIPVGFQRTDVPIPAAIVAGLLLVTGMTVALVLIRRIRRGWLALRRRLTGSSA
ncbi:MAG: hypothetical protein WCF12_09385 [Propionicimonas sp.]